MYALFIRIQPIQREAGCDFFPVEYRAKLIAMVSVKCYNKVVTGVANEI